MEILASNEFIRVRNSVILSVKYIKHTFRTVVKISYHHEKRLAKGEGANIKPMMSPVKFVTATLLSLVVILSIQTENPKKRYDSTAVGIMAECY